ncbi:MAG: hypothetical protein Q4E67_05585 [Planctomycetia bacterium]|nr:hypothetical protein [Planctomycetia bacterium]
MGGRGDYLSGGGFRNNLYHTEKTVNSVKLIRRNNGKGGLPLYSNTSDAIYIGTGHDENPNQIRFYKERTPSRDFDIGRNFEKAHMHDWVNGERIEKHQPPTEYEKSFIEGIFKEMGKEIKWEF